MKLFQKLISIFLLLCSFATAQDTIKIARPDNYDANCVLEICAGDKCYSDSIPRKIFFSQNNIELRMNGICTVKKKSDVFVSSFEIWENKKESPQYASASSSFMNSAQKKVIQKINLGKSFIINNITLHGPDGIRKRDNIEVKLY